MFIRRIYYNVDDGKFLYGYSMNGNFTPSSISDELKSLFIDKDVSKISHFEWLEPDEEIEEKFNGNYDVSVDISVEPHALVFTEIPQPEPIPEEERDATVEDYEKALSELGV